MAAAVKRIRVKAGSVVLDGDNGGILSRKAADCYPAGFFPAFDPVSYGVFHNRLQGHGRQAKGCKRRVVCHLQSVLQQNLFDAEKMFNHQEWCVDEVFGQLLEEEKIQDCIVVGVANAFRTRSQEYFPQDVFDRYSPALKDYAKSKRMGEGELLGNDYLKFLVEELKPFIDKTYSTRKDREHTFHMGSSMGGLISSYAVTKCPEVFGGAGCLSTHSVLYITNYDAEQEFIDPANQCYVDYLRENLKPNSCKLYMDRGDQTLDAQYPKYQDRLDKMFREAGWDNAHYVSRVFPGLSHVEGSWASRLDVPVLFLLGN